MINIGIEKTRMKFFRELSDKFSFELVSKVFTILENGVNDQTNEIENTILLNLINYKNV